MVGFIILRFRDKFFLNGNARYEHEKVEKWYQRFGKKIISKYRQGRKEKDIE